jgi:ADP-ribose pyrophosphatase YjhB (NUDIX family)
MATRTVAGVDRRLCAACGRVHYVDPKIAVGVAVFRNDKILLVRRSMEPGRGRWSVPGGYVDIGRDPRAEAAREVMEEARVDVEVGAVIDVFKNPPEEGNTIFVLYAARWVSGEPEPGDDADEAGFFAPDELPPLTFASTHAAIAGWPASARQ